jgi:hypothetical protein
MIRILDPDVFGVRQASPPQLADLGRAELGYASGSSSSAVSAVCTSTTGSPRPTTATSSSIPSPTSSWNVPGLRTRQV